MSLLPGRCIATVNVYNVHLQNYRENSWLYGILCTPKAAGNYPAILRVPGARVRLYGGDLRPAEEGIITFQIGIHGIPVTMDQQVYDDLCNKAWEDYPRNKLDDQGVLLLRKSLFGEQHGEKQPFP